MSASEFSGISYEVEPTGTVIGQRYVVDALLHIGQFATTYLCVNYRTWERDVVKILRKPMGDHSAELRFYREFNASCRINHVNVVKMKELFLHKANPALAMEFVANGDLAARLSPGKGFSIEESTHIAKQICNGLRAIHEAGIVHRDLKPENIFIDSENKVKIGDFGIAHISSTERLTKHGNLLGTLGYLSPEYIVQGQIDVRSDIYAVGVILFEMLTGLLPSGKIFSLEQFSKMIKEDSVDPISLRPDCPDNLARIVQRCMKPDPNNRYATVTDILKDLGGDALTILVDEVADQISDSQLTDTQVLPW